MIGFQATFIKGYYESCYENFATQGCPMVIKILGCINNSKIYFKFLHWSPTHVS